MGINVMEVYSSTDPNAKPILEKVSKYTQQAQAMNLPYWVFVHDSNPVGVVAVGKEPIQLYAPPGTPMALIRLIDSSLSKEIIEDFATEAMKLAIESAVEYALATFSDKDMVAIGEFKKLNFKVFDDCYRMVCQLDKDYSPSNELEFKQVQKEEMRQFIKVARKFLQGSPDSTLSKALQHMLELPDEFLNFYYSQEKFHFANKNQQPIGVIDFNLNRGLIGNVGVDPQQRGKGYGRQIMLFALAQIKASGCKQAYLRVHVENSPAIHLYESLGFLRAERYKTLMWTRNCTKTC